MQQALNSRAGEPYVEVFRYEWTPEVDGLPACEGWGPGFVEEPPPDPVPVPAEGPPLSAPRPEFNDAELRAEFNTRLAAETKRAFETGREQGREEGRQTERGAQSGAQAEAEKHRRKELSELIETFDRARESFLHAIEPEVVQLALAIAARILRREAQMDPLLLTGAVRVALGQIAASTDVELRVPIEDLDLWTESMALLPTLPHRPTVLAGEGMRLGECIVETRMGSVDLGIRSQIAEIERGFFDRVGRKPAGSLEAASGSHNEQSEEGAATRPGIAAEMRR